MPHALARAWAPRTWGGHLLALLALAATIGLGLWQYGVWHDHRVRSSVDVTRRAPVPLDDLLGKDAPFTNNAVGRPVDVEGRWVPAQTVLVSHRTEGGFWVVTPVRTSSGSAIAVVRGTVGTPADAPAAPSGGARLTGWLQPPEDSGLTDDDPKDDVLPELSVTALLPRVDEDLYGGYVVTDLAAEHQGGGFAGVDQAPLVSQPGADGFSGLRNILYAVEWWFFAVFVVVVWWRWLRDDVLGAPPSADG